MRLRSIVLIPIATVAIYACSDEDASSGPPKGYEDVLLDGAVTDETLVAFTDALAQRAPADVASQKAVFIWPANGEVIPKTVPGAFNWQIGSTTQRVDSMPTPRWAGLNPLTPIVPAASGAFASPLRELFQGPRRAFAHGDPYNGTATFLVFSTDTNPKLLRVFSSNLTFTPSQAAWDTMVATGKPITATLVSGVFEQNRIGSEDGPYVGATIQFTFAP